MERLIVDGPHGAEYAVEVVVLVLNQFGQLPVGHVPRVGLPLFIAVAHR